MNARQHPQQRPPREGLDLRPFPAATLPAMRAKYRAHTNTHGSAAGAWFFASGPGGRFNLEAPRGTCYMADRPQTALYELLGPELQDMGGVGIELAGTLMVTPMAVPGDTGCADLDSEDAVQFGVFNELSASAYETYEVPRKWAASFDEAGFGGVRYISRMVSGSANASWAIFGTAGPDTSLPIAGADARPAIDVLRDMGVTLLGDDLADDLTVAPVPEWDASSGGRP